MTCVMDLESASSKVELSTKENGEKTSLTAKEPCLADKMRYLNVALTKEQSGMDASKYFSLMAHIMRAAITTIKSMVQVFAIILTEKHTKVPLLSTKELEEASSAVLMVASIQASL